jgi:hypothetical protein
MDSVHISASAYSRITANGCVTKLEISSLQVSYYPSAAQAPCGSTLSVNPAKPFGQVDVYLDCCPEVQLESSLQKAGAVLYIGTKHLLPRCKMLVFLIFRSGKKFQKHAEEMNNLQHAYKAKLRQPLQRQPCTKMHDDKNWTRHPPGR